MSLSTSSQMTISSSHTARQSRGTVAAGQTVEQQSRIVVRRTEYILICHQVGNVSNLHTRQTLQEGLITWGGGRPATETPLPLRCTGICFLHTDKAQRFTNYFILFYRHITLTLYEFMSEDETILKLSFSIFNVIYHIVGACLGPCTCILCLRHPWHVLQSGKWDSTLSLAHEYADNLTSKCQL